MDSRADNANAKRRSDVESGRRSSLLTMSGYGELIKWVAVGSKMDAESPKIPSEPPSRRSNALVASLD